MLNLADDQQIEAAKKVVQKLELKNFSSNDYENPSKNFFLFFLSFLHFNFFNYPKALQNHYSNLQALALNRDKPEEITDYTQPAVEKMKTR